MGVDFLACAHCGDTFPDCGDYVGCGDDCWKCWCSLSCAKADGFEDGEEPEDWDEEEDGDWDEHECQRSCKYCRQEDYEDYELLAYVLSSLSMTREQLIESFKNNKKLKSSIQVGQLIRIVKNSNSHGIELNSVCKVGHWTRFSEEDSEYGVEAIPLGGGESWFVRHEDYIVLDWGAPKT